MLMLDDWGDELEHGGGIPGFYFSRDSLNNVLVLVQALLTA